MNSFYIIGIRVNHRRANAALLQEVLTKYGCNIKLRVGLHEAGEDRCSDDGVILLQVCGDENNAQEMIAAVSKIDGVCAKLMDLN
jgi:hypothetical protein